MGRRIKIYKDQSGQVLDSYKRSERLLTHIRWQIDNHKFNEEKYVGSRYEPFFMDKFAKKWLDEQNIRQESKEITYSSYYKIQSLANRFIIPFFGRQDIREVGTRGIRDFNTYLAGLKLKNIGIGTLITKRPSHTTVRTGPYTAVRLIKAESYPGEHKSE